MIMLQAFTPVNVPFTLELAANVYMTYILHYRAEQLAIAQSIEEKQTLLPKVLGGKLQRRGSLGGSLRRSKFKFTSQDKLDEQSFSKFFPT